MPFKSKAQRRLMYAKESRGEVPKGTAAEWESHTNDSKLPEKVKKTKYEELEPMEKGWKDSMAAMGVAAALGASAPASAADASKGVAPATSIAPAKSAAKPPAAPMHGLKSTGGTDPLHHHLFSAPDAAPKTDIWEGLDPSLRAIAVQESGSGKNVNHLPDPRGIWNTAVGTVGLQPATAAEVAGKTHALKKKYGSLLEDHDKFIEKFKKEPKFYNEMANNVWNRMIKDMGDERKAAYGWRWGAYSMDGKSDDEIYNHPYVKAYLQHKAEQAGGLKKSEVGPAMPAGVIGEPLPGTVGDIDPTRPNQSAIKRCSKLLGHHMGAISHHGSLADNLEEMSCPDDAKRHRDLEGKHLIISKRIIDHCAKDAPDHPLMAQYQLSKLHAQHLSQYHSDDSLHRGEHDLDMNILDDDSSYGHSCYHCEQILGGDIGNISPGEVM